MEDRFISRPGVHVRTGCRSVKRSDYRRIAGSRGATSAAYDGVWPVKKRRPADLTPPCGALRQGQVSPAGDSRIKTGRGISTAKPRERARADHPCPVERQPVNLLRLVQRGVKGSPSDVRRLLKGPFLLFPLFS